MARTYPYFLQLGSFRFTQPIFIESPLHAAYSAHFRGGEVPPDPHIHLSSATPAYRRTELGSHVYHIPPPLEQSCLSPACLFVFNLKGNTFILNLCPFYNSRNNKMLRTF